MNITASATKKSMVEEIKKFLPSLRKSTAKGAKDLVESINYAVKMFGKDDTKVTKKDLMTLLQKADKMLAVSASASSKKEEPKKSGLKPTGKKVDEEKKVEDLKKPVKAKKKPETEKKEEPKKEYFPETITLETDDGETEYTKADVKNMKELCKILTDEDADAVVAFYWTPSEVRKSYPKVTDVMKSVKSFENDLDIAQPVYVSDDNKLAYVVSVYTEAFYDILDYEVDNSDGDMFAGACRCCLYVAE